MSILIPSREVYDRPIQLPLGAVGAPSFTFVGDLNTGAYSPGADQFAIATGGVVRLTIDGSGNIVVPGQHRVALGAVGTPGYSFVGDPNTGLWSPGADQVAISTNGANRLAIDANGNVTQGAGQYLNADGALATPAYSFTLDPNTGLRRVGTDNIALVTGGTDRLTIDSGGAVAVVGALSAASGSVGGQTIVVTNDARLSDQRVPTAGSVTGAKLATEMKNHWHVSGILAYDTGLALVADATIRNVGTYMAFNSPVSLAGLTKNWRVTIVGLTTNSATIVIRDSFRSGTVNSGNVVVPAGLWCISFIVTSDQYAGTSNDSGVTLFEYSLSAGAGASLIYNLMLAFKYV